MPTYEYTCKNCGASVEVFQKFSDKPLKTHDVCGGELKKVFHARGVVFKGGGFYATDSRGSSSSSTSTDSNGSGGQKTDSKSKTEPSKPKTESKTAPEAS